MVTIRRLRGFTMVELMITVAVLGILAAFAVPSMTDFYDRKRLVSQTEAISNLIQIARSEAIKHPSAAAADLVTATVKPAAPWFVGLRNGGACDNSGTPCQLIEGGTNVTRVVTATECTGCTMTSPGAQATIIFDLRGMVTDGAGNAGTAQSITLQSPKGKQLRTAVSAIGRITICSPSGTVSGYPSC
jgi:type IV fimbrial biogenesis protein FimT